MTDVLRRIRIQGKRQPVFSVLFVAANFLVFIGELISRYDLVSAGGLEREAVMVQHQYWRLLTAMFLHTDTSHLCNNMIIVLFLGAMLEREVGHIWFFCIYLLSGVGGNVVSLIRKVIEGSDALSLGASGAAYGLDGLLLALVLLVPAFRRNIPPARVLLMILLSLYAGFSAQNIDNAAHVGGLIIGFLLGMICALFQNIRVKRHREVAM